MFSRNTICFCAVALLLPCFCLAQKDPKPALRKPDPPPLVVTTDFSVDLDQNCKAGQGLVIQLRYTGSKPLRGYVVMFPGIGPITDKNISAETLEEARDFGAPILPGASWTRMICTIPDKNSATTSPFYSRVDMLRFVDGSIWGPLSLRESHKVIGKIDGLDFLDHTTDLQRQVSPISPESMPQHLTDLRTQTIGPLKFESGLFRDERNQDKLAVSVTNVGDNAVRGFLFTTTFFDPATGTRVRSVSTKELETRGNPADYLAPGATWAADSRKVSNLPDGNLADYKIELDMVFFADGTVFGPLHSGESLEVLGMFEGIDSVNRTRHAAVANQPR